MSQKQNGHSQIMQRGANENTGYGPTMDMPSLIKTTQAYPINKGVKYYTVGTSLLGAILKKYQLTYFSVFLSSQGAFGGKKYTGW